MLNRTEPNACVSEQKSAQRSLRAPRSISVAATTLCRTSRSCVATDSISAALNMRDSASASEDEDSFLVFSYSRNIDRFMKTVIEINSGGLARSSLSFNGSDRR